MSDSRTAVLPYRVGGEDLARFLNARARGRDNGQVQAALNLSAKSLEGILSAATALGFLDTASGGLSDRGRRFALASSDEVRRELVIEGMLGFEPYELLFEAVHQRGDQVTPIDWVETWWNTHGYGSSASNRAEASTAFAHLVGFAGLGSFIPGRRGHRSRIEWVNGSLSRLTAPQGSQPSETGAHVALAMSAGNEPAAVQHAPPSRQEPVLRGGEPNTISLSLPLGPNRVVEIRLPSRITAAEKERLMQLVEVLIAPAVAAPDPEGL